jgi:hypothetical protein
MNTKITTPHHTTPHHTAPPHATGFGTQCILLRLHRGSAPCRGWLDRWGMQMQCSSDHRPCACVRACVRAPGGRAPRRWVALGILFLFRARTLLYFALLCCAWVSRGVWVRRMGRIGREGLVSGGVQMRRGFVSRLGRGVGEAGE